MAHPQVKLFITHGGLLSLIESIYHGKPVLVVPIYFDQILNANRAEQHGYGLSVDYYNLNQTYFTETIRKLMEYRQFEERAQEMSHRYRDQPMDPLEKAIYWTEYVLRHRGANFLRSPAQDLNFWQRNSMDTAAVFSLALTIFLCLLLFVSHKIFKLIKVIFSNKQNKEKPN